MQKKDNDFEFIKWTGFETAYKRVEKGIYKDCLDDLSQKEYKKIRGFLIKYLIIHSDIITKRHNGGMFNGWYHQERPNGVPVIKYKDNLYVYKVSMRRWGDVIAEVLSKIDKIKYEPFDKIQKELGNLKEKEKLIDEESYSYLDFAWTWDRIEEKK